MEVKKLNKEVAERIHMIAQGKIPKGYCKEKDCIIPEKWKVEKCGDIISYKNGLNYSSNSTGKLTKIVGVGDFKDRFYLDSTTLGEILCKDLDEDYYIVNGDMIFVRSNGNKELIGRILFCENIEDKVTFSGFTIRGRVISKEFIPKFCAYYFSSTLVKKQYIKMGGGTNISNLSQSILGDINIFQPTLNEQKRIIEIVSTWDKAIELKEKLLLEEQQKKQGLLEKVLLEAKKNHNPKKWVSVKISEVLDVRDERETINAGLELYSLTIEDGVTPKCDRYNRQFLVKDEDKKYKVTKFNDVVYNPANLRFGAIALNKVEQDVLLSPIYETLYLKDDERFDINFIAELLMNPNQIKKFSTMAEGTLVERMAVKVKDFMKFKIDVPSDINEQVRLAKIFNLQQKQIEMLKQEIEALKEQKKGLMQLLLTGIVRVKVD